MNVLERFRLDGKTAIVTGGTSRFGAPIARALAEAGANVVMPNLSPVAVREKYKLYDNKICTGDEAAECRHCMARRMESVGYKVVVNRGDYH